MQAVASLAAQNLRREIQREVVGAAAWHRDVTDADLGLHRAGAVDDDHAS
jgi:hypothetical protein